MNIESLEIPDIKLISPSVFSDDRGYFMETFNQRLFNEKIKVTNFLQDNESSSSFGVLRGLHFQEPPYAQAKLMRVITGEVFDVMVDLRSDSQTYGKHVGINLDGESKQILYLPKGFAHGFLVLSKYAVFTYKVDSFFNNKSENTLHWKDETLNIKWPLYENEIILSEKDKNGLLWDEIPNFNLEQWSK